MQQTSRCDSIWLYLSIEEKARKKEKKRVKLSKLLDNLKHKTGKCSQIGLNRYKKVYVVWNCLKYVV